VGLIAWLYHKHHMFEPPPMSSLANPLVLLAGFFVGVCIARIARFTSGEQGPPFWFQDVQAWIALLSVVVLIVQVVVLLFINPSVSENLQLLNDGWWDGVVAALIGFYFGARS
jgi:hypothetical protein